LGVYFAKEPSKFHEAKREMKNTVIGMMMSGKRKRLNADM
jgi:hypothetical protein